MREAAGTTAELRTHAERVGARRETEEGLWRLAKAGWRVLERRQAQQDLRAERRRLHAAAGAPLSLLEGHVAGRPVVYRGGIP